MMSNSQSEIVDEKCDFGKMLSEARRAQNLTVSEIYEHIKLPEEVILAIESCDLAALPAPTFTQGYLRTYARFLDVSDENVLDAYHRALPGESTSELKPSANQSGLASSHPPLIKMVTVFLIIAGVAALIYGSVQYYQEKADVMETELESKEGSFTGNSLDSLGSQQLEVKQNAHLTEDGELALEQSEAVDLMAEESEFDASDARAQGLAETEPGDIQADEQANEQANEQEREVVSSRMEQAATNPGEDVIKFFAEQGSWMEVRDANNVRLFYNTLPAGASRSFTGLAPFRVFMGNAATTTVEINNLEVDITGRIRSNNTARFKISSEQKVVIFH